MPEYQEKSIVQGVERLADSFYRLTLHAPRIAAAARPGQFVMAACGPALDPLLRRPFSIHRCPGDGLLQLLIRVVGKGTGLLAAVRPEAEVSLVGPLGHGFHPPPHGPIALVGGGIGIAPLLFFLDHLRLHSPGHLACTALLGSRTGSELEQLKTDFAAADCQVELATDDGSLGHHGLITDLLQPLLPSLALVYACGPHPMMATVAGLCRSAGVPCQVSLEAHMACGLGACLGCTIHGTGDRYLHVCKDGPVVAAEEVAWNR